MGRVVGEELQGRGRGGDWGAGVHTQPEIVIAVHVGRTW